MRYLTIFLIVINLFVATSCSRHHSDKKPPEAVKGVLDLSDWDFDKDGPVTLNGDWEFYWNQLLVPLDFDTATQSAKKFISIPGAWNDRKPEGKKLGEDGYATFRLLLKLKEPHKAYALEIIPVLNAFNIWVDGRQITSVGKVGKSKEAMIASRVHHVARLHPDSPHAGQVQLLLQVSNFHGINGGIQRPILFGTKHQVQQIRENKMCMDIFLLGGILIMSLYHFGLYFLRRKEISVLYFGIFSFIVSIRIIFSSNSVLLNFYSGLDWETGLRILFLTALAGFPVFLTLIKSLFPEECRLAPVRFMQGTALVCSIIIFFTPADIFTHILPPYSLLIILFAIYGLYVLIRATANKKEGAGLLLAGGIMLLLAGINDALHSNFTINTGLFVPFALFAMIFIQAFILSRRFTNAFTQVEVLTDELQEHQVHLEELIEDRTFELQEKNTKITDSLEYAKMIQRSLLPVTDVYKTHIPESFAIWEPRDIFGGDIIFADFFDDCAIVCVVDCTGHGIPGAFMSMIASSGLRKIISDEGCHDPAEILKRLNYFVTVSLQQDTDNAYSDDGMDMALCAFHKADQTMTFAGAKQSLFYIHENELTVVKGDRQSIGYKKSKLDFNFKNNTIDQ